MYIQKLFMLGFIFVFTGCLYMPLQEATYTEETTSFIKASSNKNFRIISIEYNNDNETLLHCQYINPFKTGGWACVHPKMFLENMETGASFKLMQVSGDMVNCEEKRQFTRLGEVAGFTLHFPLIVFDKPKMRFNLIEPLGVNPFSVYDIEMLEPK